MFLKMSSVLGGAASAGCAGLFGSGEPADTTEASPTDRDDSTRASDSPTDSGDPTETDEPRWSLADPRLPTRWTEDVGPDSARPEYPRPQLVRETWESLNGVWQFAAAERGEPPPVGEDLEERILVPFPVESALSGIGRREPRMWYRRTFAVPDSWAVGDADTGTERLVLHFEAVDYRATVYVNGTEVTTHRGGYDSFSVDVTDALTPSSDQELVIGVHDPTDAEPSAGGYNQPIGKQRNYPESIWYTSCSGIWQSVWMEPVPAHHVSGLDVTPDPAAESVSLTVDVAGSEDAGLQTRVTVLDDGEAVTTGEGPPGTELTLPVPDPELWSPENPHLYDLEVRLLDDTGETVDAVRSYFGMRSFGTREVNGTMRPTLNGEFVFHVATLDQGYWPDGIYAAPTDEALRYDLEVHKELGFNAVRKHIKVEPKRWYYWADRLGLLVWQDMPSPPLRNLDADQREQFRHELHEMVAELGNHPSIAVWVPFNESWGAYTMDVPAVVEDLVERDPERLVLGNSGFNRGPEIDPGTGDFVSLHEYPGPAVPAPTEDRASACDEWGSIGLSVAGHSWSGPGNAARMQSNARSFVEEYVGRIEGDDGLIDLMERCGLSAAVYTQLSDIEDGHSGFVTYDREVLKPTRTLDGVEHVREAHDALRSRSRELEANPPERRTPPADPDPVGYWPMEAGDGDTAGDRTGGNDASLDGGVEWTAGPNGPALRFDGTSGVADTHATVLDTRFDYTVAAWVKLDALDGIQTAVSQELPKWENSVFLLQYVAPENAFSWSFPGGRVSGDGPVERDQWYHLTGVLEVCERNRATLYVDGERTASERMYPRGSDGDFLIGRATWDGSETDFWNGWIDDVRAYEHSLGGDAVRALYERDADAYKEA